MAFFWNRDFLTRRIDRCYLIAAGTRKPEKRRIHLELARYYRRMLASLTGSAKPAAVHRVRSAEWATPAKLTES